MPLLVSAPYFPVGKRSLTAYETQQSLQSKAAVDAPRSGGTSLGFERE